MTKSCNNDNYFSFPSKITGVNHRIFIRDNSKKLIIIFSAKDLGNNKFNFWQFGKESEENVIFLNNGLNEWYQNGINDFGSKDAKALLEEYWVPPQYPEFKPKILTEMGQKIKKTYVKMHRNPYKSDFLGYSFGSPRDGAVWLDWSPFRAHFSFH